MERGSSRNDTDLGDHLRRSLWTWTIQSQAITIMGWSAGIEAVAWWVIFVCPLPLPGSADFSGPLYSTAQWSVLEPRRGAGRGNQWRETLSREKVSSLREPRRQSWRLLSSLLLQPRLRRCPRCELSGQQPLSGDIPADGDTWVEHQGLELFFFYFFFSLK